MSYGTYVKVYVSRVLPSEAQSKLYDCEREIEHWQDQSKCLCFMDSPSCIDEHTGDDINWLDYAPKKLREITESLEDAYVLRCHLQEMLHATDDELQINE